MEGFLKKRGAVNKRFKLRYFKLIQHRLEYYKTRQDALPIDYISLEGCTAVETAGQDIFVRRPRPAVPGSADSDSAGCVVCVPVAARRV